MLHTFAAAAIAFAVAFFAGRHFADPPEPVIETVTDTLVVYDTVTSYKPVPFNVYVVDTLYVPVPDPAGPDTIWVQLPREAKVYRDSTYRAVVSGYRPSLDTIDVYRRTVYVDRLERVKVEPSRWSWGVQAGVGYGPGGVAPYAGIGIQYRIGYFEIRK